MPSTHMFSMSVEPEFDSIIKIVDSISRKTGLSRSVIIRTALHNTFGVPTSNGELEQMIVAEIRKVKS